MEVKEKMRYGDGVRHKKTGRSGTVLDVKDEQIIVDWGDCTTSRCKAGTLERWGHATIWSSNPKWVPESEFKKGKN